MDTHRYLLDTNILSSLIRNPQGPIFKQLNAHLPATACTSIVVAAELQFGLCKGVSERLRTQVEIVLAAIDVLPLEPPVDRHYGEIRAYLQKRGEPIGHNDLFIAAHACALGLTLITENVREFARVPNLQIENWLEDIAQRVVSPLPKTLDVQLLHALLGSHGGFFTLCFHRSTSKVTDTATRVLGGNDEYPDSIDTGILGGKTGSGVETARRTGRRH